METLKDVANDLQLVWENWNKSTDLWERFRLRHYTFHEAIAKYCKFLTSSNKGDWTDEMKLTVQRIENLQYDINNYYFWLLKPCCNPDEKN